MKAGRLLAGAAVLLVVSGCAAWRIGQSVALARASEPFAQAPAQPTRRLLVVGDSTAVGTGATVPAASLAGLIGAAHPMLLIENRARDGATFAEVARQLDGGERFDLVLVQAGGNDVIRLRPADALRDDVERVVVRASALADQVLLMPAGNVGNAPAFFAPLSWLMTARARELHAVVRAAADRHGATYVNLFKERADDPFARRPELNARDGLHPSDAGYRIWYDELVAQAGLANRLRPSLADAREVGSPTDREGGPRP